MLFACSVHACVALFIVLAGGIDLSGVVTIDPWHWLACNSLNNGEMTRRHDAVADAIGRAAWQVGAQVQWEVKGLNPHGQQRPDLKQCVLLLGMIE